MPSSADFVDAIARAFVGARAAARALTEFPGPLPTSLAEAYSVQERAIALGGRRVRGWKVATIHPDFRTALGAERMAGPVFADAVHELPAGGETTVTVFADGFAALEAEFVARFATDLKPGPHGFTPERILAALGSLHAGAEVASSPLAAINDIGPMAVVSDHGNNAGAVVGPELPGWRTTPPERLASCMLIDGVTVGEGTAARVPGGPLGALGFLAGHLAARGRHLAAGDIVLTGMTTGIHPVRPGTRGRIVFTGVPACDIVVAAAGTPSKP
jgi:2-keto-4-pentenoate hydratase